MKKSTVVAVVMAGVVVSSAAQEIVIRSFHNSGYIGWDGTAVGTTATIQWAASLTDAGRTNWHQLTNVVITAPYTRTDVPMFFRVIGTPDPLTLGLVAWYPLDGNAVDASGHGNDLVISGAQPTSNRLGAASSAYTFDGNDSIASPSRLPLLENADQHTVSAWVKSASTAEAGIAGYVSDRPTMEGNSGYHLTIRTGTSRFALREGRQTAGGSWDYADANSSQAGDGLWHHLTGVRSNGVAVLYVDGVQQTDTTTITPAFDEFCKVRIGTDSFVHFTGVIDSVRIYNRALASNEVWQLFSLAE